MKTNNFLPKLICVIFFLSCYFHNSNAQPFQAGIITPNITYLDIVPDTIIPASWNYFANFDIDIDSDGIKDIRFQNENGHGVSHSSNIYKIISLANVQFFSIVDSIIADTIGLGSTIDNSLYWNSNSFLYLYSDIYHYPSFHYTIGVCTQPNIYISFRKINSNDTLLGWFNIDMITPFRIKSFGTNKNPQDSIPTPQNVEFSLSPNPSNDIIVIKSNSNATNYVDLSLYNSIGQRVLKENISFMNEYIINTHPFPNGIFFVVLKTDEDQSVHKVVIQHYK